MARLFVLLAGFGVIFAFMAMLGGRFDSYAVQVTFFGGGVPTYNSSNFENCGPKWSTNAFNGSGSNSFVKPPAQSNSGCYAYLKPGANEPLECDYNLGFRAGTAAIKRLRVRVAIIRDGKDTGRHSITIDDLNKKPDSPYVSKSIRGECDADQLQIVEARAFVDGQETNLITAGSIHAKGLVPLFPDFFVKIAEPAGA
jgi:hypothetical protein